MRSPFAIFRKHQKELMVVLIGLAMFSFIILGSITQIQNVPRGVLVVLAAIVMGFVFWVVGAQAAKKTGKNKQKEYALSGVLLGVAISFLWIKVLGPNDAVQTNAGNISGKELNELKKEREIAVQFMRRAYVASVERPPQISPQLLAFIRQRPEFARLAGPQFAQLQQWNRNLRYATFYHEPDAPVTNEEVVEKYVLLQEADKMGIRVNDDTVRAFLDKVTKKQFTKSAFLRIRKDLGISNTTLNRILRTELKAQIARTLLMPRGYRTPEQYWSQYRKLNVKQHIEAANIPVREFLDQVADPKDSELTAFFDKYKTKYPVPGPSAEPAFAQEQKVSVAYIEAEYKVAEKYVLKELEDKFLDQAEIKEELKKIAEGIAEAETRIKDRDVEKGKVEKEREYARRRYLRRLLESGGKIKRFDFDIVKYYEDNKSPQYENPAWAPAFPDLPKSARNPFPEGRSPAKARRPGSARSNGAGKAKAPRFPEKKNDNSKSGKNKQSGTGNSQSAVPGRLDSGVLVSEVVALQPETDAKQPLSKGNSKAVPKKPAKIKVVQPPPPNTPRDPPPKPFRLLTDGLKMEIREKLLGERTRAEVGKRLDAAAKFMGRIARRYDSFLEGDGPKFDPKKAAADLKAYAAGNALTYKESEYLTPIEFQDPISKPVPFADEFVENIGGPSSHPPVISRLYSRDAAKTKQDQRLYSVLRTREHVFWKIGHKNRRIPEFKDTGVKEQVKAEWRKMQAQKLARKRATDLAKLVQERALPMDQVLLGTTVTGADKSHVIKTHSTKQTFQLDPRLRPDQRFSWMINERRMPNSSAPNQRPQEIAPEQSRIPGMDDEKIGDDFMKAIFEEIRDGEVGVAYNRDKSTYFVVRVFDRTPGGPEGRRSHMSRFLNEDLFIDDGRSLYQSIPAVPDFLDRMLRERLWEKYDVKMFQTNKDNSSS